MALSPNQWSPRPVTSGGSGGIICQTQLRERGCVDVDMSENKGKFWGETTESDESHVAGKIGIRGKGEITL